MPAQIAVDVGMMWRSAFAFSARASLRAVFPLAAIALAAVACAAGSADSNDPTKPGPDGKCDADLTLCNSGCASLLTDIANCGTCGHECPSDKTCTDGKCVSPGTGGGGDAGALSCTSGRTHCGSTCADTMNDPSHCGSCTRTCPSGMGCQGGTCTTSCSLNQVKCTDGCYDTTSDNAHCGSCTNACLSGQTCTAGVCCSSNEKSCGGACVDVQSNANNCGACGATCSGSTPFCSQGACKACNANVLLLGDATTTANTALANALTTAGLHVTTVDSGATSFTGTPAPSSFGVVIVTNGNNPADMASAGQSALLSAQQGGTGIVLTEWAAYEVASSAWTTLAPLVLLKRDTGTTATLTFTLEQTGHPIWSGLPTSFTTVNSMGSNVGATVQNGGTRIAGCTQCGGAGVAVRDTTGGRIVHMAHAGSYSAGAQAWTNDTNITQMMVNSVKWASRCQ